MEIVAKFVDYSIYGIEFFIKEIGDNFLLRDIPGLTNNKVQKINITKEHPLVTLMASSLVDNRSDDKYLASIIPGVGVVPGDLPEEGETIGSSYQTLPVTQDWVDEFITFDDQQAREQEGQVTDKIIEDIEYKIKRNDNILAEKHQFRKNEGINVSLWVDFPDSDILFGIMLDSILHDIKNGFAGDDSKIKNMQIRTTKGLTNFNFGRVLYGTEYAITFLNTYNNYTIFTEDKITDVTYDITHTTPGEEA